jgi:hypothetical protein
MPPPLPHTEPVALVEPAAPSGAVPAPVAASTVNESGPGAVSVLGLDIPAVVDPEPGAPTPGAHTPGAHAPDVHAPDAAPQTSPELAWAPPAPRRPPALAGWALAVAITGLIVSLVVGWGFPVGIIAIITAIAALRRPGRRRQAAGWALALGILSILYSALWIAVAASRGALF